MDIKRRGGNLENNGKIAVAVGMTAGSVLGGNPMLTQHADAMRPVVIIVLSAIVRRVVSADSGKGGSRYSSGDMGNNNLQFVLDLVNMSRCSEAGCTR